MRAIFYLLLISLVLFLPSVYGETFPQAFSTSININANNCTISVSTEDSNSDFTFNITSPLCSITNTSNAFTFSKQVSPLFIRNVTCGDNLIENLTTTCTEMFEQVLNIGNFTQCKEGKARLEENFNNINEDFLSASSLATKKTKNIFYCDKFYCWNNCTYYLDKKKDSKRELSKAAADESNNAGYHGGQTLMSDLILKILSKPDKCDFIVFGDLFMGEVWFVKEIVENNEQQISIQWEPEPELLDFLWRNPKGALHLDKE